MIFWEVFIFVGLEKSFGRHTMRYMFLFFRFHGGSCVILAMSVFIFCVKVGEKCFFFKYLFGMLCVCRSFSFLVLWIAGSKRIPPQWGVFFFFFKAIFDPEAHSHIFPRLVVPGGQK